MHDVELRLQDVKYNPLTSTKHELVIQVYIYCDFSLSRRHLMPFGSQLFFDGKKEQKQGLSIGGSNRTAIRRS